MFILTVIFIDIKWPVKKLTVKLRFQLKYINIIIIISTFFGIGFKWITFWMPLDQIFAIFQKWLSYEIKLVERQLTELK